MHILCNCDYMFRIENEIILCMWFPLFAVLFKKSPFVDYELFYINTEYSIINNSSIIVLVLVSKFHLLTRTNTIIELLTHGIRSCWVRHSKEEQSNVELSFLARVLLGI